MQNHLLVRFLLGKGHVELVEIQAHDPCAEIRTKQLTKERRPSLVTLLNREQLTQIEKKQICSASCDCVLLKLGE
jgi:hypothetical protein